MKVFIDTNILVDLLCNRIPFNKEAKEIFTLAYEGKIDLVISSLSYINAYYIGKRYNYTPDDLVNALVNIAGMSSISIIDEYVIESALNAKWKDFEDAVQFFSAQNAECDCIVTRNAKDFNKSTIKVMEPSVFTNSLES